MDHPPVMKAEQILGLLPHRYPFLLIDRVLELTDDKVVALKNVTLNEPFFQGAGGRHPRVQGRVVRSDDPCHAVHGDRRREVPQGRRSG